MDTEAPAAAGFSAGSRIAGYQLEERIGQGGMAVVFRARDERLERMVALKILSPALAADESFRDRFIRESRSAAAVDHPHIIPVFEAGESDGVLFLAMRYVPGGDAGTLVRRLGPLPAARAAAIISAMASALDAAHAAGLVHRDVKPANMLMDTRPGEPDHVYLSDFGLTKGTLTKGALTSAELTGTGYFLGTLDYCAPEQIEGGKVDAFSPDGKTLATGDKNGNAYLWDISAAGQSATLAATLTDPSGAGVWALAFSPDSKTLATGDFTGNINLWNLTGSTSSPANTFTVAGGQYITAVAFSPDGATLATGNYNGTTYLWNVASGARTVIPEPGTVWALAISKGGTLAIGDSDGSTYPWRIT